MEEYTREQIQRADDTDLYVFLSGRGEQFKRCGKEYRWLRHDSVMINKSEWYRFSQNKGGHAIDFMKEFYGLSFAEAVKELLGEEGVGETNRRTAKEDAGRQKVCPISVTILFLFQRCISLTSFAQNVRIRKVRPRALCAFWHPERTVFCI